MYKTVIYGHLETADKLNYPIYKPSNFEELVNRDFVNQVADFLNHNPQVQTELQQIFNNLVDKYTNNNLMQLTPILKNLEKQLNCFSLQMELYNDDTMLSINDVDERLSVDIELASGFINFNVYEPIDIEIVQIVLNFQKQLIELN